MKTNRRRKDLFGKMKKGTLIALLCVGGITASAQTIGGNVYGGGNAAEVGSNTVVKIEDGTVNSVFGGGCKANVKGYADVLVVGGTVKTAVFGGNDINGTVQGSGTAPTTRNGISTDAPMTDAFVRIDSVPKVAKVFGGGNGQYDYTTTEYLGMSAPTLGTTYVMVDMTTAGSIDSAVFGGGNAATVDSTDVVINETGHIHYIFGGGNAATVLKSTNVLIDAKYGTGHIDIDTIFGGNNKAMMSILPNLDLKSGYATTVYGGGNAGSMTTRATSYHTDVFGESVTGLSTYLYIYSDKMAIDTVYGGCRDAAVSYNTFIDIRNTMDDIDDLFGGNDHGGTVGSTRVDAVNGTIINLYGASNGDYFLNDDGTRNTYYVFPNCGSTNVNIYGGTFTNIYGGGYAGNVTGNTYMLLDDQIGGSYTASITGKLFGGGYGYEPYALSKADTNVGNVYGTAITDAKHITNLTNAKLYGGGNAGDVDSTLLTLYSTWDVSLDAIYGGCRASNVRGTAHTILQPTQSETVETSHVVFGGNDFAGTTNNSILDIYSGHYNRVYGAGNGDYKYDTYAPLQAIAETSRNYIPVSGDVNTNFYGGIIDSNLYGCSEMGYVYKNIHDTNYNAATASTDISKYSTIITNIHGGLIKNDVFGGAHGRLGNEQLVYGIKIINMDGGTINYSLHGGSESVNDGYPNECKDPSNTTQRPSSVVNITGGTVRNRTFGGGYMGQIYGSVYVNVGKWAVDSCEVWNKKYAGAADASYASLKPEFVNNNPVAAQLMVNDLALEKSIYSGADWGTSGEDDASSLYYNKPCFHGGKSELSIDGRDYNSSNDVNALPFITLNESLYGSGTSSEGGDIIRIIKLKNYGEAYGCENTYRSLKSIQRADSLTIQNVNLELIGAPSNVALYSTPNYTISRIDKEVRFIDKNFFKMDAPINQIGNLTFYKHTSDTVIGLVDTAELNDKTVNSSDCDDLSVCSWRGTEVADHPKYTTLYMMQGNYIEVRQWKDTEGGGTSGNEPDNLIDDDAPYGAVLGYAYFTTESGYMATIIARPKEAFNTSSEGNPDDGGFLSNCKGNNHFDPANPTTDASEETEMAYETPAPGYRVWNLRNGTSNRRRNVNIVAHNEPELMPGIDREVEENTYGTAQKPIALATAIAELAMPPSAAGHYFRIDQIIIDNENRTLNLANAGLYYEDAASTSSNLTTWATDGSVEVQYREYPDSTAKAITASVDYITGNPQNKFGLTFQGWNNFDDRNPIVISGNTWGSGIKRETASIDDGSQNNVIPTARLTLTYSPTFTANTQRTVTLMMTECNANGDTIAPLEVVITIETLTKELGENDLLLLAMFNDGISNEYEKKVLIPATQKDYDFYLNKVEWKWAKDSDTEQKDTVFMLRPNTTVNNTTYPDSIFSLKFQLSEDISSTVKEDNAWRSLTDALTNRTADFCNIIGLTDAYYKKGEKIFTNTIVNKVSDNSKKDTLGLLIGELDGRFTAAINVTLTFNGEVVYPKDTIIGTAKLTFKAKNKMKQEDADVFTINIKVQTRSKGDTIYIASARTVTRDGITLHPWNYDPADGTISTTTLPNPNSLEDRTDQKVRIPGKMPDRYVQSLNDALDESITGFVEGDVLCIIDTLDIKSDYICRGTDYNVIQVVRYDGSHFTFPGEGCAYRGPMIRISEGANFTAWNMRFDGKGLSRICKDSTAVTIADGEKLYDAATTAGGLGSISNADNIVARRTALNANVDAKYFIKDTKKYFHKTPQIYDTTISFGPIFMVTGANSSLTLNNRTYVVNNFNLATDKEAANSTTQGSGKTYYGGAIVVRGTAKPRLITTSPDNPLFADAPMVELVNNVDISNNLVMNPKSGTPAAWTEAPRGAGIEVENGIVLLSTHKDATIKVLDNYYVPTSSNTISNGLKKVSNRFYIDTTYFTTTGTTLKNNIHLTRTVGTVEGSDPDDEDALDDNDRVFNDSINDIVYMRSEMSPTTKIGINKWFPAIAPYYRDTIQFAMAVSSQTRAERAFNTKNFPSDSSFEQIYHISIDPYLVYYKRCTGFRLQDTLDLTHFPEDLAAIRFDMQPDANTLPTYDKLSVRVKGGLFPRTYTWYEVNGATTKELQKDTSAYSNTQIRKDETGNYRKESNTGSYLLGNMKSQGPLDTTATYNYRVKATDLMGCEVSKDIQLYIQKFGTTTADTTIHNPFDATAHIPGYWIDRTYTISGADSTANDHSSYNTDTAAAKQVNIYRTIKGVKVKVTLVPNGYGIAKAEMEGYPSLSTEEINKGIFTPGDVLTLNAIPNTGKQFLYWDYDPYAPANTEFIVPSKDSEIEARFAPGDHWYEVVTEEPSTGYRTDYGGNIHISTDSALAWFISVANGLNGQQLRAFTYDTVFIAPRNYNMEDHLWTPVGTDNHKFLGVMMREKNTTDDIIIDNVVINEPEMNHVGFFGVLDEANISDIQLTNTTAIGLQYVGTLAGKVQNKTVIEEVNTLNSTSITNYASGGLVGDIVASKIDNCTANPTFLGSAIYNGGVAGTGTKGITISSTRADIVSGLKNVIYQGSEVGKLTEGETPGQDPTTDSSNCRVVSNCSMQMNEDGSMSRVCTYDTICGNIVSNNYAVMNFLEGANASVLGGIVGSAENVSMINNYAYGDCQHGNTNGAIVGQMGDNVFISNCYYETGMAPQAIGSSTSGSQETLNVTAFNGEGNNVTVNDPVNGIDNLTRILNIWVSQQPEEYNYRTWRSDLEHVNNGYPIFGTPDIIPVYDTIEYTTCDYYDWNGEHIYESGIYSRNFTIEELFVDSTVTLMLTINSAMLSSFEDSVELGLDYYGYGFNFSATEQELLRSTIETEGFATIEFFDTLQTVHGCDSVISLTLTVYDGAVNGTVAPEAVTVKVYPNPTTSIVNVEATGLKEVEVYDNASRRIADSKVDSDHCIINLNNNASGSYYLRIYTKNGVAIRKVIKK